ncbi:hypothetical protein BKA82DRAFT_149845, partial [Pisolithus tinctorius]
LLHYTSKVWQDWHDKAMWNQAYNIRIINKDLLADIRHDLDAKDIQSGLDQVSNSPQTLLVTAECQTDDPTPITSPTTHPSLSCDTTPDCCCTPCLSPHCCLTMAPIHSPSCMLTTHTACCCCPCANGCPLPSLTTPHQTKMLHHDTIHDLIIQ